MRSFFFGVGWGKNSFDGLENYFPSENRHFRGLNQFLDKARSELTRIGNGFKQQLGFEQLELSNFHIISYPICSYMLHVWNIYQHVP
jgi:hypothetical protein